MKRMTLICAIINSDLGDNEVILVKKKSPLWQSGRWNLPGGKVEEGETFWNCARREFKEEIGVEPEGLIEVGTIYNLGNEVHLYVMRLNSAAGALKEMKRSTNGDEEISLVEVGKLMSGRYDLIPNLYYYIPLCFAKVDNFEEVK